LNPFGYTGAYQFQDGTVHLGHRFYDTNTLNFTQPDPSRQEMNNFAYAMGDPINNTDPTGLMSASDAGNLGAGLAGLGFAAVAVSCGITIACAGAMMAAGAVVGAAGGAAGAGLAGGTGSQVAQSAAWGAAGGALTGPLPAGPGMWGGLAFNLLTA